MMMMERPETARAEWNHSCTAGCPNPCPYSNVVERTEGDIALSPEMTV